MPKTKTSPMQIALIASMMVGLIELFLFAPKAAAGSLAAGPLEISYTGGEPVFSESNIIPGASYTKDITVTNNGTIPHSLALGATNVSGALANDLYLEPLLADAWRLSITELAQSDQTVLADIAPGETTTFTLQAELETAAGNNLQNQSVSFDLIFGTQEAETAFNSPALSGLTALVGGTAGAGEDGNEALESSGGSTEGPTEPRVEGAYTEQDKGFKWQFLLIVPVASIAAIVALPVSLEAAVMVPTVSGATTAFLAPRYAGLMKPWVFWLILAIEVVVFLVIKYYRYIRKAAREVVKEVEKIEKTVEKDLKKMS